MTVSYRGPAGLTHKASGRAVQAALGTGKGTVDPAT